MITKDNFKEVVEILGFKKESVGNFYRKKINDYELGVDFQNKKLAFGPKIKGGDRNTLFDEQHKENMVVFECVVRLLNKGYRPEHIELEKVWSLGHEQKSARADVIVYNDDACQDVLMIIECKTAGVEYKKAKSQTETDGGQLFSYWQQERSTKWLCLYASDLKENKETQKNEIVYTNSIIWCEDDKILLEYNKKLEKKGKQRVNNLFDRAFSASEKFKAWKDNYDWQSNDKIIFGPDAVAYKIGTLPLRYKDLKEFDDDSKGDIIDRFAEILRHNKISDKENAFNRLIAMFISKLQDESTKMLVDKDTEVEFQYKDQQDTYESLQDRLQKLFHDGMQDFMKEEVFYVADEYTDKMLREYNSQNRTQFVNELKGLIRKLKFYSNNDFSFKNVHNEDLFFQNGKVVVEMVQLFQEFKLVHDKQTQFLGDIFERLLNKGFKQSEGQFFTPLPITRFIWDCLPLEQYISQNGIPKVIDYACGAGHFLIEAVSAINHFAQKENNDWTQDKIFGIEADDRLARVSKVSMFMNGAGKSNIIYGDGLDNYKEKNIAPNSFDILVANPPYSVDEFKSHLNLRDNQFELMDYVTENGSEIETFFVERIAQLVKRNGLVGVILPSSILSNNSGSYTKARKIILENFLLKSIVCFGSKTFGATGTNTVVLFLQKYDIVPFAKDKANAIFNNTIDPNWGDDIVLKNYLQTIDVDANDYLSFVTSKFDMEQLKEHNYFKMYADDFLKKKITYAKKLSEEERKAEELRKFYEYALPIEKDKVLHFAFTYKQKTVVVTAPADNTKQEQFLGYKWSNRKGDEGLKFINEGGLLYNPQNRLASDTMANCVRMAFNDQIVENEYTSTYSLSDLMDFARSSFDCNIKTKGKKIEEVVKYKFQTQRLENLLLEVNGNNTKIPKENIQAIGQIPVITQETDELISGYCDNVNTINDLPLIVFGDHSCSFKYIDFDFVRGADGTQLIKVDENTILTKYLYYFLCICNIYNSEKYERHFKYLRQIQIPLPSLDIQSQIVLKCTALDNQLQDNKKKIDELKAEIEEIIGSVEGEMRKLGELYKISSGGTPSRKEPSYWNQGTIPWVTTTEVQNNIIYHTNEHITEKGLQNSSAKLYKKGSIVIAMYGQGSTRGRSAKLGIEATTNQACAVLYEKIADCETDYVWHYLQSQYEKLREISHGSAQPNLNAEDIKQYQIPVPSLEVQQEIVSKIETIEQQISKLKAEIESIPQKKKAILEDALIEK